MVALVVAEALYVAAVVALEMAVVVMRLVVAALVAVALSKELYFAVSVVVLQRLLLTAVWLQLREWSPYPLVH